MVTQIHIYLQEVQGHRHPIYHKSHDAYPVKQDLS